MIDYDVIKNMPTEDKNRLLGFTRHRLRRLIQEAKQKTELGVKNGHKTDIKFTG